MILSVMTLPLVGTASANAATEETFPKGMPAIGGTGPAAAVNQASLDYFYADTYQFATATGDQAQFLVADPTVAAGDYHSLAETSVESSDQMQIIEEGWTVDPGQFGDTLPHLFIYHWINGVGTCYDACGFVQVSSTILPGMALTPGQTLAAEINYADGNWNIYVGGTLVGYFPGSIWSGDFTSLELAQWFGEVAASSTAPCTQMGDGLFANTGGADTIDGIDLIGGPATTLSPNVTNPNYYTQRDTASNSFQFGGPGACASLPAITKISPSFGPIAGGTTVTISGTNLNGATQVLFGSTPATSYTVVSPSEITAVSPAQAAAALNVYVITPAGTSAAVAGDVFTYTSTSPTSSVIIPASAATLTGSTTLDASASNASSIEFRLFGGIYGYSGPVICTATPTIYGWLCSWNTTTVPSGSYTLLSEAFNSTGSAFSSGVNITVKN